MSSIDGDAGATAETSPSCEDLRARCGSAHDADCCASPIVTGGTFDRSYDSVTSPATVTTFRLDAYEVTVARFRRFVAAYRQDMIPPGAGKNPNNTADAGWDPAWNTSLPTDSEALAAALKRSPTLSTWTDTPGANEELPVNTVTWFEAFAFCVWDRGRLPTEAEWHYAAAGGAEQRKFPWGGAEPDCAHATFRESAPGTDASVSCGITGPRDVGTHSPTGDSRWGQADLAGNLWEWVLDWYSDPYPSPCIDCAATAGGDHRVSRGGAFNSGTTFFLESSYRSLDLPLDRRVDEGIRCAR